MVADSGGTLQERITVKNSGNVGIGTTSPGAPLNVIGSIWAQHGTATDGGILVLKGNTGTQAGCSIESSFHSGGYGPLTFATSNTERARIDSSGRLLVGTSSSLSPTNALLQVAATGEAQTSFLGFSATAAQGPRLFFARSKSGTIGTNTAVASGDNVGNVIFAGADGAGYITAASIESFVDGTPGTNDMPGRLVFSTTADGAASPTERMRITNGGAVAIGLTTPGAKFHIDGVGGTNTQALNVTGWGNGVGGGAEFKAVNTGNADVIYFSTSAANVGKIAITSTATSYVTSSDYRLKENVIPVANATSRLKQLKPSRFNFIAEPDRVVDGFIAHEAQAVVPECVTGEKDEVDADDNPVYQGIDQSKLVPLLTAALQEAIAKIETLEARLTAAGIE
jgi:hypothetical protein